MGIVSALVCWIFWVLYDAFAFFMQLEKSIFQAKLQSIYIKYLIFFFSHIHLVIFLNFSLLLAGSCH